MYCGSTEAKIKKDQERHSNQLHKRLEKILFRKQREFAAIYTHRFTYSFDYTKRTYERKCLICLCVITKKKQPLTS